MTRLQLELNKLLEQRRANQASEELTRVRDERSYALGTAQLKETQRANQVRESQTQVSLDETQRSNLAREAENYRSNYAREQENYRSNVAREAELRRSNLATELWRDQSLALDTEIRRGTLAETQRANIAREGIQRSQVQLGYSQLAETARSNLVREAQGQQSIDNQYLFSSLANSQRRRELDISEKRTDIERQDSVSRRMQAQAAADRVTAQNVRDYAGSVSSATGAITSILETPSEIARNFGTAIGNLGRAINIFRR